MDHPLYTCRANHYDNIASSWSPWKNRWTDIQRAQVDMTQYVYLRSVNEDSESQKMIYWDQPNNQLNTGPYHKCWSKGVWRMNPQPDHGSSGSITVTLQVKEQQDGNLSVNFDKTEAPQPFFEIAAQPYSKNIAHIFEVDVEGLGHPFNLKIKSPLDGKYYYWYIKSSGYIAVQKTRTAGFLLYETAQC